MFKYFRSRHANNLTTQLDGILMYSSAEYRIPYGASVVVESDTSIMCPYNHFIRVKQTMTQEEKNIKSWFIFENKTGKDQFVLLKTKITNTIHPEFALNVDKSIVINKLEPIGVFQVCPCATMDGIVRVLNQNDFFEEQKVLEVVGQVPLDQRESGTTKQNGASLNPNVKIECSSRISNDSSVVAPTPPSSTSTTDSFFDKANFKQKISCHYSWD